MKLVQPLTKMQEAEAWLESLGASTMKLGLARIERLLAELGNPEQDLPVIHIAGTNGKGSVLAMLAGVLKAAGYKTGTYTSPHLLHVRERIAADGAPILPEDFVRGCETIRQAVERMDWPEDTGRPTYFEVLNVLAFLYFKKRFAENDLDMVILETGLGGRLDSTNVVKHPNVCVITGIDFDHQEHLGDTLAAIAREKAGILKPGTPVVLGPTIPDEAKSVITDFALKNDAPLTVADASGLQVSAGASDPVQGLLVEDSNKQQSYRLSLAAPYQRENLATVLAVVAQLREQGFNIAERAVADGLAQARWPGRFQFVAKQRIVLDVSHNAQGFQALGDALEFYFANCPLVWMVSLRKNRESELLQKLLARFATDNQHIICTHGDPHEVYHAAEALAEMARHVATTQCAVETVNDPLEGLARMQAQLAETPNAVGVITGSLYTAGSLLQKLS